MSLLKLTLIAFIVTLLAISPLTGAGTPGFPLDPSVTHQVLVRLGSPFPLDGFIAQLIVHNPAYGSVQVAESIESRKTYRLVFPGLDEIAVADDLAATFVPASGPPTAQRPLIWAEANYHGRAAEGKTGGLYVSQVGVGSSQYTGQYASDLLGLPQAHTQATGVGTVVAILDTGVDATHAALGGKVLPFGHNFVNESSFTSDLATGTDSDGDGQLDELVGHGTYVAGLVHLVAPQAGLLPVVVLDSEGIGDAFDIGQGMYFAIDKGVEVINMSLGSTYKSQIFEDAVDEAMALGIVVTGAAGNFSVSDPEEFPALQSNVFGTAALSHLDIKAAFSNYHQDVTISAPGDSLQLPGGQWDVTRSIISTIPGGGYVIWEGTSFSTALVSGVLALTRSQHPQWAASLATYAQMETILTTSALPIDAVNPAYEDELGAGRARANVAVASGPAVLKLGDLDASGAVTGVDLAILLGTWGQTFTAADLNGDGDVDGIDLAMLLSNWS